MARGLKQFRYYSENDERNAPNTGDAATTANLANFANGNVFRNANVYPIIQLGIQAIPGTKVYINGSIDPVVIGSTGIYEIDLIDRAEIVSLMFDATSMMAIRDSSAAYLLVDVLYDV